MSVTVVMRFVSPLAGVTSAIIMSLFLCFLPAISQTSWPPTPQGVQLVGGATQGVAGLGRKLPCARAAGICVGPTNAGVLAALPWLGEAGCGHFGATHS